MIFFLDMFVKSWDLVDQRDGGWLSVCRGFDSWQRNAIILSQFDSVCENKYLRVITDGWSVGLDTLSSLYALSLVYIGTLMGRISRSLPRAVLVGTTDVVDGRVLKTKVGGVMR